jgi:autotransporter-associated beta strand protein
LTLGGAAGGSIASIIGTSTGTLTKAGTGTWTLSGANTYSGATTISAGTLVLQSDAPTTSSSAFNGPGSLVVQSASASFSSGFTFSRTTSGLGGLTLGRSGNTQAITVSTAQSVSGPITVYGGNINLNAGLTATSVTLASSGTVSNGVSGFVSASELLLQGGNVTLTHASNAVANLAASGVGNLSLSNSGALTVGTVGTTQGLAATGTVSLSTATGNLTIAQGISTSLINSASALSLNAGVSSAVGTITGGNIIISGSPIVTVGSGSTARLFSGSVSGSILGRVEAGKSAVMAVPVTVRGGWRG